MENSVDIQAKLGYNVTNNDDYAQLAGVPEPVQIVKMDEQQAVNDTECTHQTLIPDPNDTIGDAVYHGCSNYKCGRGWYIVPEK